MAIRYEGAHRVARVGNWYAIVHWLYLGTVMILALACFIK